MVWKRWTLFEYRPFFGIYVRFLGGLRLYLCKKSFNTNITRIQSMYGIFTYIWLMFFGKCR